MKIYFANGQPFTDKKKAKKATLKGQAVTKQKVQDLRIKDGELIMLNGQLFEMVTLEKDSILVGHAALVLKTQINDAPTPVNVVNTVVVN